MGPGPVSTIARASQDGEAPLRTGSRRLFLHDVGITMGAEVMAMASSLLLTALLSRWMGTGPLSEYLLFRRVLSWSVAAVMLGVATGLPRYVAQAAGRFNREQPAYFLAALLCMIPGATVTGAVLILNRAFFARWLFGDAREAPLIVSLAVLLFGYSIHRAVYGYYRGVLDMVRANVVEVFNLAFLPLGVVLILAHHETVAFMMTVTGILMAISALLFAVPLLHQLRGCAGLQITARCLELLQYGLPRIPGEFGAAAMTALGPMLAVHFLRMVSVAPLLLGLNVLLVVGYAAGPLGVVLLSKVSMMLGQNQHEAVRARLRLLVTAVVEVSVFVCLQLAIFADVVVRFWVGPGFANGMGVIRLVLLAIPPYLFFMALRSTIDAVTVKPYNTANVMACLGLYVGVTIAWIRFFPGHSLLAGIAIALLASQVLLAMLTARVFRQLYGVGVPWRRMAPALIAAVALSSVALGVRMWQSFPFSTLETLALEVVLSVAFLAILARLRSGWLSYVWHVGVRSRADWSIAATDTEGVQ